MTDTPKLLLHQTLLRKLKFCCNGELKRRGSETGSCHKRQKPQAPTPQAPIRNRQTRRVANAMALTAILT